ncbi:MAG: NAD(P)/FAD-dependent oxidoreductase [Desulfobacterales bacterium]|jgi:hydrogen cyanide synthase HcnB|nr:NAD(P)/FAD-dependent oxidoreductase [Desulfobacterales bacterium]MDP6682099.1 NAD(P)/FAD-dependent oxidoreductase [Desulfobacterales bacterium]MDP6808027.1 NAD(P)/FAD-dependent oxidoreductase [Desulfobacterales bacterium]|tara:strand:+ start:50970 stop:52370 length:1401 start_codon:yes stop_codon:yes gene_type:complete
MNEFDLIIIGGGPSGITAATEAVRLGASVALVDENRHVAGNVFHHRSRGPITGPSDKIETRIGAQILKDFDQVKDRISVYLNTEVWNFIDKKTVSLYAKKNHGIEEKQITGKKLIIAEGAFERVVPFPGWTLPGVFSIGGLNAVVKGGVVPGKRFLVAGSGPLQFVVAHHLINAGAEIEAIADATSLTETVATAFRSLTSIGAQRLRWRFDYIQNIRKQKIPIYRARVITKASGINEVEKATIVRVDRSWRPIKGTEKVLPVDAIAYGFGLIPSTTLTRLCGCRHTYDAHLGYWRVEHNDQMETSIAGVFVAGDGRTIKGYAAAIEEGRVAATEAAVQLGYISRNEVEHSLEPARKKLKRFRRFGRIIDALSATRPGVLEILSDDTIVCRCEEVTLGKIASAVADGAIDVNDVKRRTRLGMGHCQGRICGQLINELIWKFTGDNRARALFTPRIPAKPVPFEALTG